MERKRLIPALNQQFIIEQEDRYTCAIPLLNSPDSEIFLTLSKYVFFHKYKSKFRALCATKYWRDKHLRKHYGKTWKTFLKTGMIPFFPTFSYEDNDKNFVVTWHTGPPHLRETHSESFSAQKLGKREAKKLAKGKYLSTIKEDSVYLGQIIEARGLILEPGDPLLEDLPTGITRMSHSGRQGWLVLKFQRESKYLVRSFFPDENYDYNPESSRDAAFSYLEEQTQELIASKKLLLKENGEIRHGVQVYRPRRSRIISGIHRRSEKLLNGGIVWHWAVSWSVPKSENSHYSSSKRFSDSSYRDDLDLPPSWFSFIDAVAFRQIKEIELYGKTQLPDINDDEKLIAIYNELINPEQRPLNLKKVSSFNIN